MDIERAATELQSHFHRAPWFTSVGVGRQNGREVIFLYVNSVERARAAFPQTEWHGFPVIIRKMTGLRPAAGRMAAGR